VHARYSPLPTRLHRVIYWVIGVGHALAVPVIGAVFVPKYHRKKLNSVFSVSKCSVY